MNQKKGDSYVLVCMECGEVSDALYHDPRSPPLDVKACMCRDCVVSEYEILIEDLQEELDAIIQDE